MKQYMPLKPKIKRGYKMCGVSLTVRLVTSASLSSTKAAQSVDPPTWGSVSTLCFLGQIWWTLVFLVIFFPQQSFSSTSENEVYLPVKCSDPTRKICLSRWRLTINYSMDHFYIDPKGQFLCINGRVLIMSMWCLIITTPKMKVHWEGSCLVEIRSGWHAPR